MQGVGEYRTGAVATDDTVNCGNLWNTRLLSVKFSSIAFNVSPVATAPVLYSSTHSFDRLHATFEAKA